jgi:hypothetical protein
VVIVNELPVDGPTMLHSDEASRLRKIELGNEPTKDLGNKLKKMQKS